MKTLTAGNVKRLQPGTDVFLVEEKTGHRGRMWIIKSGRKKLLKGILSTHEIIDRPGWHYEIDEEKKS